jgi:hypothetical protein
VNKNCNRRGREQSAEATDVAAARVGVRGTVVISELTFVEEELETERMALCGQRYEHQVGRQALRSGHVPSALVLGGRRVKVE